MKDGTSAHIDIEKIDERSVAFHFPGIVANPVLTLNMYFGPKYLYAPANPYFDETIKNQYTYNPEKAIELLASIGIKPNSEGKMTDITGNPVEFNLTLGADSTIGIDTANIFADECGKIGLNVNVKPLDFQKVVDMLLSTYDWHAVIICPGSNYWPTQGSNVWMVTIYF